MYITFETIQLVLITKGMHMDYSLVFVVEGVVGLVVLFVFMFDEADEAAFAHAFDEKFTAIVWRYACHVYAPSCPRIGLVSDFVGCLVL